ncbi:MAG TPA: SMC family ATPase, partial [Abditibacteriaceae bacterium]|nr:SMC family ATPase [Abditibacteriaceae bacterium]
MIPVRVQVEGFMSYRDRAELQFQGSPLWMLSGPNGAGKSTIFDAITFVLYGLHRGGKQDARELINHDRDALVVEFDFAIGAQSYRVRRTLSKRNRSTFQAFALAPDGTAKAIAETESKAGFDTWIENTIGLDHRTFTASVLLQQGKSDALLEANPAHRHAMLSQIVDLSEYEKLHHKTDTRRKEFETEARVLDTHLQRLEVVDEAEIERLGKQADEARARVAAARQQLQELAALKVLCLRWHELQQKHAEIEAALAGAQELFAQEIVIRRDAARREELRQILPHLQQLQTLREQSKAAAQRLGELEAASVRLADQLAAAQDTLGEIQT